MTASRTLTDLPKRLELGAADQVLAVPFGDRLAGSHARSRRRALRLRPHLADTGLVVIQLGVGVDLVETRVFEGPL